MSGVADLLLSPMYAPFELRPHILEGGQSMRVIPYDARKSGGYGRALRLASSLAVKDHPQGCLA